MAGPHTARARARAQMLDEIKLRALEQLAAEGAANLSLRAIARDLGLVSSGIYRYYANRDELLTALIIDAYQDLTRVVTAADAETPVASFRSRWLLRCTALRDWARTEPARFQLIYGSPVSDYRAPQDTVAPAGAVVLAFFTVVSDAAADRAPGATDGVPDPVLQDQLDQVAAGLEMTIPAAQLARAVGAFGEVIGLVTLELGGHFVGGFEPAGPLFASCVSDIGDRLGLVDAPVDQSARSDS